MAVDTTDIQRVYRTTQQHVGGWVLAVIAAGTGMGVLLVPTHGRPDGYVIALVAFAAAVGMVRFARCGVFVTSDGVRVRNMFKTTVLAWGQIKEFRLSPVGPSQISLKNGKWVSIVGIEQTNIAGLTNRQNTRERRMIDELNELLRTHAKSAASSACIGCR